MAQAPSIFSDILTITTGGMILSGWTETRVTRSVERFPSDFQISLTERFPGSFGEASVAPGSTCSVSLGGDKVLTGYIDVYSPSYSGNFHQVVIQGRSKGEDLVDSSYIPDSVDGWQLNDKTLKPIFQRLLKPFPDIQLQMQEDKSIASYPVQIQLGQTVFELMQEYARIGQVIVYDDADGNLVVGNVGTGRGSPIVEGQNIEAATARIDYSQRFAKIEAVGSMQTLEGGLNQLRGEATDDQIRKSRTKLLVMDTVTGPDQQWAQQQVDWEMNRRKGRSLQVQVVVTGWRDANGQLWTPNSIVSIEAPNLKVQSELVIVECSWIRGEQGTQTEMLLMPKEALQPEPFHPPAGLAEA